MGFPEIHLINLDRSTERLEQFRRQNPHIERFSRVSAVDGALIDRRALVESGVIKEDLPYPPGALGCALSHVKIWEKAVREKRPVTVFEDDIVVSRRFFELAEGVLATIPPDWDFVLWGYMLNPLFVWVDLGATKARLHCYGPNRYSSPEALTGFQESRAPAHALPLLHCFGTQAYSISAKGARAALEFFLPMRSRLITFPEADVRIHDEGVDCALCELYPLMASYICIPQLAIESPQVTSVRKAIDADAQSPA